MFSDLHDVVQLDKLHERKLIFEVEVGVSFNLSLELVDFSIFVSIHQVEYVSTHA